MTIIGKGETAMTPQDKPSPDDGQEDPGDVKRPEAPDYDEPDQHVIERTLPKRQPETGEKA
jgi:hypothetical protein